VLLAGVFASAPVLLLFSATKGFSANHALIHAAPVVLFGLGGANARFSRRARATWCSLGLLTASALLVHAWDGVTEAHFAFFVVVVALTLYEDWFPFVLAVVYVLLHHGVVGALHPAEVYSGVPLGGSPWGWAAIHALFIAAAGLTAVIVWRFNEQLRIQTEDAMNELRQRQDDVLAVTRLAGEIAGRTDGRVAVCEATRQLTDVIFAGVMEPDAEGNLTVTASAGAELPAGAKIVVGREPAVAATAFTSKRRQFVSEVADNPAVWKVFRDTGARSAVYEPLMHGDQCVGVLVAAWGYPIEAESSRDSALIRLLANEAADAIDRSDLLKQLQDLACKDPLTGLANRRAWEELLDVEAARATRTDSPLCVALLDLDHFKEVNDTRGHRAGDRLLRSVSAAWSAELRETDFLGRLGGDEFGLVLPDCELQEAHEVLARLRGAAPQTSWSAGLVVRGDGEQPEALVSRVDEALYRAKANGRRCVAV
jgi:diguanylate cyclase (GGDEF)-like protein